ncbi:MAG TPA: DUF3857 domain-containing transglutaminase family protein [Myxococcaceae bacterium]|nr:DUF3857 domain-containing transglutaminase family protein [Myxococcaceae bacterium]
MIRPICLLAAALLIGACASGPASRPADAEARHSRNSLPSYSQEEAAPVEDFEYHVRVELLEDGQYRRTLTERYTLLTASPPRFYARLETEFDPDEDERPELSATVTLPGGTAKTLDPSTIAESPAEGSSGDNLTSRRRLVAPLPSLVAGAKIERITVSHKSRPRLSVGRAFMHPLGMTLPVKSLTFVLDHPVGQQIVTRALKADVTPTREEKDGRVITTWQRTDVPGVTFPLSLPPEERLFPTLWVSSASGWPEVIGAYHTAVAPRLTSDALAPVLRELKPASSSHRDVAAAALEWMHHHLRYTGLDFGNAGVIPQTPEETLKRGYGDCKDLSAFLVALLEASGVPARMVLVHTADWEDPADDIAGLNRFDHAVVQIPGATPLWIDPTLRGMPVGTLSPLAMNRIALVVAPETTGLSRTPVGSAAENRAVVRTEITLPSYGLGTVKTIRTLGGTALAWPRLRAQNLSPDQINRDLAKEIESFHGTADFTYRHSDPLSGLIPFEDVLEIQASNRSMAADSDAAAALGFEAMLDFIPDALESVPDDEAQGEAVSGPVFIGAPRTLELVTRVRVSPLFEFLGGPVSRKEDVGSVHWSYAIEPLADGAEARVRLTFNDRVIPADEVSKVRQSLQSLFEVDNHLEFANRPFRLLEDGKLQEAVTELREMERQRPKDPLIHSLLARAAHAAGLIQEAQTLAREARDLGPMQAPVARTVSWLLGMNASGVEYGNGYDREAALAAIRVARHLEPDDAHTRRQEVGLLAHNAAGDFGGNGADVEAALDSLNTFNWQDPEVADFHALLLFKTGRDEELLKAKTLPDSELLNGLRLAARARSQGAQAAIRWADQHVRGGQKQQLYVTAMSILFAARAYPEAHALSREVKDPGVAQFSALVSKAVRRESAPFDQTNPRDVILEGLSHALGLQTRVDPKALNLQEAWKEQVLQNLGPTFRALDEGDEGLMDALWASMTPKVEDLPGVGVLVTLTSAFGSDPYLLQREKKTYRFHPIAAPEAQQLEAWKALGRGELDTVRSWFRYWFALIQKNTNVHLPAGLRKLATGNRQDLALALSFSALPQAGEEPYLGQAIRALSKVANSRDSKDPFARMLTRQYVTALSRAGKYDEALAAHAKARAEGRYDDDGQALFARAQILSDAKRAEVLDREGKELLDHPAHRKLGYLMRVLAAEARLDPAAYRDVHLEMVSADVSREGSLNNAAWAALFLPEITDADVHRAELAVGPQADRRGSLDTLALLLAQRGEVNRAVATLARLAEGAPEVESAPTVLYARGRVAESLGFNRAARALYKAVPAPNERNFNDVQPLAKKRLEAMEKKNEVRSSPAR